MRFLAVIVFLILTTQLFSQHTISGKVVDAETGEGLIGAHVYLVSDWRKGAISGLEGKFSIEMEMKNSTDSIIVSYVGFRERLIPVAYDEILIELESKEILGETVTVTAKPLIAEEFQYMEIKKIDIYTNPSAKADPILAVNSLPSSTTTDESANISLRGSSPIETGIFLNNVPVYDAVRYSQLNGIGTFSIFNTAIIEDVTVFPGNPPLEFGNVTSGVVSLDTDQRVLEGNTNSLTLSLANIGYFREQKLNENQSLKLFTNWQPSYAIKEVNAESLKDIKSFSSNDFGLYWYGANENMNWKVLSYSNIEGYKFNYEHPSFQGVFDQEKIRSFLISSFHLPIKKGELSINNGISVSNGDYSYSNVAFKVDKRDFFGGLNYHFDHSRFSLKTGLSYDQRFSKVSGNFHQYGYALDTDHPTVEVNESLKLRTLEGFVYFKYYLNDDLAVGTGLRKNIPTDSLNYLSRQLNFSYQNGNWSTTFGIGKYHKTGLFENTGEAFRSESNQLSLDIKYEKGNMQMALSIFDKDAKINQSEYKVRGVELYGAYQLSDKFSTSGSITWLDADNKSKSPFQYDLSYFIRANFSYKPGGFWTIESILNSRQGRLFTPVVSSTYQTSLGVYEPFYSSDAIRLPDYWNVGLSVSKMFLISADFNFIAFASLNNALDHDNLSGYNYSEDYSETEARLFSQRTGYLGVVVNF